MNPKDKNGLKKPQMHLIPYRVMKEVSKAMEVGAKKYGKLNWRKKKIMSSQYISANARHMGAWQEGEDLDPESGLNHVDHAIATLLILRDAIIGENLIDDRHESHIGENLVDDRHESQKTDKTNVGQTRVSS